MNKNSCIYVAGHKGLVGSAIMRKLLSEGYAHLATRSHHELELTRQGDVEAFFESERPEYVFLAAARVGGILANSTYPADFIYNNIMIQSNVIHAAFRAGVKKLLLLGSSCIYPRDCPQPMKEEHLLSGKLEPTNEPYAIAKIAGIKMCQAYNRQHGTNFISVMPTNLYGPGDNFDLETSHVLPALIRKFHEAKVREADLVEVGGWRLEGERAADQRSGIRGQRAGSEEENDFASNLKRPVLRSMATAEGGSGPQTSSEHSVVVWGTGTPRREFLHVDDLAEACLFLMNYYEDSEIINIGMGKDISISELGDLIKDIVGYKGPIHYDRSKSDGTPRKLLDVNKLKALGWQPKISLREGIERTYDWYVREGTRCTAQGARQEGEE